MAAAAGCKICIPRAGMCVCVHMRLEEWKRTSRCERIGGCNVLR
jgi:hypothetical protein